MERFFPSDPEACEKIRRTFAKIWGLEKDKQSTADIIKVVFLSRDQMQCIMRMHF